MTPTRIGGFYGTAVSREVCKLLELRESDLVELVFDNGLVYVRKAEGYQHG
ncbi:MAG: hypothetical protein QW794_07720 [Thermosphaera sp.]